MPDIGSSQPQSGCPVEGVGPTGVPAILVPYLDSHRVAVRYFRISVINKLPEQRNRDKPPAVIVLALGPISPFTPVMNPDSIAKKSPDNELGESIRVIFDFHGFLPSGS